MPNQILVADQQLGFVREYLPEPLGQVGRQIVQEGPSLEPQDLIVRPGHDIEMVKMIEIVFTLARRKVDRNEVLLWRYDGDVPMFTWPTGSTRIRSDSPQPSRKHAVP